MTFSLLADPNESIRICLTLLHSIWQFGALALVAWCTDRVVRSRSVEWSYVISVAALVLGLLALPVTYLIVPQSSIESNVTHAVSKREPAASQHIEAASRSLTRPGGSDFSQAGYSPIAQSTASNESDPTSITAADPQSSVEANTEARGRWSNAAPWFVGLYAVGVAIMLFRLAISATRASRLIARSTPVTEGPLVSALQSVARTWSIRAVPALARAEKIVVPKLVGIVRPTILLPASAISGLSPAEIELILAHELAHVRRHDMWVNLFQRVAESLLFFNPPLWFLSRRISTLREYCCDEMTCRASSASSPERRLQYAVALLRVVESAGAVGAVRHDLAALSASGRSPSEVRRRVARLFGEPLREPLRLSRAGIAVFALLALTVALAPTVWNSTGQAGQEEEAASEQDSQFGFRFNVVGPDGAAVPHVNFRARIEPFITAEQVTLGEIETTDSYYIPAETDEEGRFSIVLSEPLERLVLNIVEPGYGPYWTEWNAENHSQVIPNEFTAELEAAWSIGGIVADAAGQPIEGVEVDPSIEYKKRPGDGRQFGVGTTIKTDAQGTWRYDSVPSSLSDVHIAFNHPDYQPLRRSLPRNGFELAAGAAPTSNVVLKPGLIVTGTVTDEAGEPIADALVRTKFLNELREARTDENGVYRLRNCEPRMTRIVVSAEGKALELKEIQVLPEMETVDFTMQPGGTIRVRILDEQGNGIPGARVFFQRWRGRVDYFEFDHVNRDTDENGDWIWNEAPHDDILADIVRPNEMQLIQQRLTAGEEVHVFKVPSALVVSGSVVDAVTREPIESFRVLPGIRNADPRIGISWIERDIFGSSGGQYQTRFTRGNPASLVRIEADGYEVATSRDFRFDEGEVKFDFELQPATDIASTILTFGGEPAAGAKIAVGVAGAQINIKNGSIDDGSTYATQLNTDEMGRFSIPPRDDPFQLVITHPAGFAHFKSAEGRIPDPILLTPWATVEGTFRVASEPKANVDLDLYTAGINSYGNDVPNIFTRYQVTTGEGGLFRFERVFPGTGRVARRILLMVGEGAIEVTSSKSVPVEMIAGQTTKLDFGSDGRPIIGQLIAAPNVREPVIWNFALIRLQADVRAPVAPSPPENIQGNPELRQAWWEAWKATEIGEAWTKEYEAYQLLQQQHPYFTASVERDGTFRINDVPPGDFVLSVSQTERHESAPGKLSEHHVTVPPTDGPADPFELGRLMLETP